MSCGWGVFQINFDCLLVACLLLNYFSLSSCVYVVELTMHVKKAHMCAPHNSHIQVLILVRHDRMANTLTSSSCFVYLRYANRIIYRYVSEDVEREKNVSSLLPDFAHVQHVTTCRSSERDKKFLSPFNIPMESRSIFLESYLSWSEVLEGFMWKVGKHKFCILIFNPKIKNC